MLYVYFNKSQLILVDFKTINVNLVALIKLNEIIKLRKTVIKFI